MSDVIVPELGESIHEGTILKLLKHVGDTVEAGEAIAELETDKVNLEIIAESSGVIIALHRQEGESISVGEVLAVLGVAPAAVAQVQPPTSPAESPTIQMQPRIPEPAATPLSVSPSARRQARTKEWATVTKQDTPTSTPTSPPTSANITVSTRPDEERVRLSRRRLTIARHLTDAQHTAAMLTTFNEADMSAVLELRKRRRDRFKEQHGINLGFMSFFTKAVVGALKMMPALNAEIQGEDMIIKHHFDIGIAVSTDKGLVVPVVNDADRLSFAEIEREIAHLAERARNSSLSLAELQGGTFTITNGGVFGSLLSTPILNAPQVGILGLHKIQERPVAVHGQVVIRPMMYLALSYDHRIVDGSEAVRFLVRVKELIEDPESLLLEG